MITFPNVWMSVNMDEKPSIIVGDIDVYFNAIALESCLRWVACLLNFLYT